MSIKDEIKTLDIRVTRDCIFRGKQYKCRHCPIALAFVEHPDIQEVEVGRRFVTIWFYDKSSVAVPLEEDITAKIIRFDTTKNMQPFQFTLKVEQI